MMSSRNRLIRLKSATGLSLAALMLGLAGCASHSIGDQVDGTPVPASVSHIGDLGERVLVPAKPDPMVADPVYSDALRGFSTYDWTVSEYVPAAGLQNVTWNKSHVALGKEHLSLMITLPAERGQRFASGEIQTMETLGYGSYEAVLRPAAGSGLLSSFYSRAEGEAGIGASEFGFAFPGRDTRQLFIRMMVDGEVMVQDRITLDFDAASGFHVYGFEWTPDELVWTVDGEPVHRVERTLAKLPARPAKLFANVWAGTPEQAHWMGRPRFSSGASLDIACVSHRPLGRDGEMCRAPAEAPRAMAVAGGMGR